MANEQSILEDILDAYTNDSQEWADIYEEGGKDVRVLVGDVWEALDPIGFKQRKEAQRMMIQPDELGQYINQVVNDVRSNPRGIKYAPGGDGSSPKGAELYQNKTREIEYRSHATLAYTTAFQNAVERGYGYVRVNSRYVHEALFDRDRPADASLFNQELWIDAVPNPDMVLPDPSAQRPDLGDMQRCFVLQWRTIKDFKRAFPDATQQSFTPSMISKAQSWFTPDLKQLLTAEYWSIDTIGTRTLLILKPPPPTRDNPQPQPIAVWQDQVHTQPSSEQILQRRKVPLKHVVQRITNGVEILETNQWAGKYIPISGCFGKILYLDSGSGAEKQILSMTRLAREPLLAYAYLWSCELEVVGMTPKFPYFFYEGQLSPDMLNLLAKSLHEPVAAIGVKSFIPGLGSPNEILPFPQRNPYSGEALQYLELGKEAARRAIQAAMGISPLPTQAQRHNEKSGVALKQIESSGQRGSFHFVDGYEGMIRQVGVMIEDQFDKTYDTKREIAIRKPGDEAAMVWINDPDNPDSISTKGTYQPTVSVGPATESQRVEASDMVETLVGNIGVVAEVAGPKVAGKILAKSIRLKQLGPIGDEMADDIDPPPQDDQAPPSPQAQAAMQENARLKATVQQLQQVVQTETLKYQHLETIADKNNASRERIADKDRAAKIETARISAAKQSADLLKEAEEEAFALGLDHAHEADQADRDRAHELGMAAMGQAHAIESGDQSQQGASDLAAQGHQQALEQGDVAHQQTLEQTQQAADLAPEPATDA